MRREALKLLVLAAILACGTSALAATVAGAKGGGKARTSIVGGGPADFSQWPFTVALLRSGRFSCGGTVIAPTKVLTAAHCVERIEPTKLAIIAGRPLLSDQSTGEVIGVAAAATHPDYPETRRHDMAVLTLVSPTAAPPVTLASVEENPAATAVGTTLRVAGWGAKHPLGLKLARYIKQTTEKVRTAKRCRRSYGKFVFKAQSMICMLGKRLGKYKPFRIHSSACSGDSGGPLVADTPLGPRQVGIVSYGGSICGGPGTPTVYARVSDGLDFISANSAP